MNPVTVTPEFLHLHPLPRHQPEGDKQERGNSNRGHAAGEGDAAGFS